MNRLLRGGLLALLVFASLSCSTDQGDPSGEEARPAPEEVTREVTKVVTVAEAPKPTQDAPPAKQAPTPSSSGSTPPAAPAEAPATQEESPEDVLALQYRLINAGDYEGAYALFADQSKQIVSPEQYRAFFEANAPYAVSDYSFPSVDVRGDAATIGAAFTVKARRARSTWRGRRNWCARTGRGGW